MKVDFNFTKICYGTFHTNKGIAIQLSSYFKLLPNDFHWSLSKYQSVQLPDIP